MLLNRDNYFVFQPLLADILSAHDRDDARRRAAAPDAAGRRDRGGHHRIDRHGQARDHGCAAAQKGDTVTVAYDELVVALGSITDFRSVPGMAEHAIGIRTLGDAFYLRNRALDVLEEARLETDPARRARLLTTVVVGGGSTGVEVAAELHDLFQTAAKTFTADPPLEPRVVLVHGGPYLLNTFGESLGKYTTRRLAKTGVELVLNRRLASVEADRVVLDDGIGAKIILERALRESEERFYNSFEHAGIGMAVSKISGEFEQINRAMCKLLGYTADELRGLNLKDICHPDDAPAPQVLLRQLVEGGEVSTGEFERRFVTQTGATVWVSLTISLVLDSDDFRQVSCSRRRISPNGGELRRRCGRVFPPANKR